LKIFARNLGGQFASELGGQFNRCVQLVLRINICGENRHLRQARNRYAQVVKKTQ
jgi:hypothetical protein